MQVLIGAGLAGVALTIPAPDFFRYTLAFFWLLAFSSATHDIAADGFYMLGLSTHDQAWFVGIRSTFYRLAMITGQGLLVIFAGSIESSTGLDTHAIEVRTAQDASSIILPADSVDFGNIGDATGLVSWPESVEFSIGATDDETFLELSTLAKEYNAANGFLVEEDQPVQVDDDEPGLWSRTVGRAFDNVNRWRPATN